MNIPVGSDGDCGGIFHACVNRIRYRSICFEAGYLAIDFKHAERVIRSNGQLADRSEMAFSQLSGDLILRKT